ncbi:hypothetical protein FNAPI_6232 [Fusarium napiforme]|uniref:Uncharacterized protein n=1 Tax=Fusarium napiforme TaxID=42672 RepID=A0A8H5JGU3_9HYPO|nr:hypothetical protein FNAPI_6232 [Fusarium napiforme]
MAAPEPTSLILSAVQASPCLSWSAAQNTRSNKKEAIDDTTSNALLRHLSLDPPSIINNAILQLRYAQFQQQPLANFPRATEEIKGAVAGAARGRGEATR